MCRASFLSLHSFYHVYKRNATVFQEIYCKLINSLACRHNRHTRRAGNPCLRGNPSAGFLDSYALSRRKGGLARRHCAGRKRKVRRDERPAAVRRAKQRLTETGKILFCILRRKHEYDMPFSSILAFDAHLPEMLRQLCAGQPVIRTCLLYTSRCV